MGKKPKSNKPKKVKKPKLPKYEEEFKYDYEKLMDKHHILKNDDPCNQITPKLKKKKKSIDVISVMDEDKEIGFMCAKPTKDPNTNFKFLGLVKKDNTFLTIDDENYNQLKSSQPSKNQNR
jgi:nitrate reductase beta subunit